MSKGSPGSRHQWQGQSPRPSDVQIHAINRPYFPPHPNKQGCKEEQVSSRTQRWWRDMYMETTW